MAQTDKIEIIGKDLNVINTLFDKKFNWNQFINTPTSIVSGTGHNHDDRYYRTSVIDEKFQKEKDKLKVLVKRLDSRSYRTDILMSGGTDNSKRLNNYKTQTEVSTTITPQNTFIPNNAPSFSFFESGYFMKDTASKVMNKFEIFTLTISTASPSPIPTGGTFTDIDIFKKGFVTSGGSSSTDTDGKFALFSSQSETWQMKESAPTSSGGRPMLSSLTYGFTKGSGNGMVRKYTYSSGTVSNIQTVDTVNYTTGLNKNSDMGFWIGGRSFKQNYMTQTFNSIGITQNGSNCTTSELYGTIVNGGDKTVSKLNFQTESVSLATNTTYDNTNSSYIEI